LGRRLARSLLVDRMAIAGWHEHATWRSALDFLSQLLRGTPVALALPP